MVNIPKALEDRIKYYENKLQGYEKLSKLYRNCCLSTIETALEQCDDGTFFVLTGDIPAMWLRDSAAQITHYLPLANDAEMAKKLGADCVLLTSGHEHISRLEGAEVPLIDDLHALKTI